MRYNLIQFRLPEDADGDRDVGRDGHDEYDEKDGDFQHHVPQRLIAVKVVVIREEVPVSPSADVVLAVDVRRVPLHSFMLRCGFQSITITYSLQFSHSSYH